MNGTWRIDGRLASGHPVVLEVSSTGDVRDFQAPDWAHLEEPHLVTGFEDERREVTDAASGTPKEQGLAHTAAITDVTQGGVSAIGLRPYVHHQKRYDRVWPVIVIAVTKLP